MIGEHEGEGESDQAAGARDPAVEDVQNGPALSGRPANRVRAC